MCTLSWLLAADRFELFFNRDERRSRKPANPPAPGVRAGVRFLAPTDGDHGGSWIGVNELGVVLCLLNGSASPDVASEEPPGGLVSRGLLLTGLIDCDSPTEVLLRLDRDGPARYRPFVLVALGPPGSAALAAWDGVSLETRSGGLDVVPSPLISSSFRSQEVRRSRTALFERMLRRARGDSVELHLAYHASHEPRRGPHSICMHRPEARTVSFSHVVVEPGEVAIDYTPDSPCRGMADARHLILPRRSP